MRWEAANTRLSLEKRQEERQEARRHQSGETVEAAIARLRKAYTTAMSCVGVLHRLHTTKGLGDDGKSEAEKVALAARTTFETSILADPLIVTHSPTWSGALHELAAADEGEQRWSFARRDRPSPPFLTSSSHKMAVREIAYLALQNYAELLTACHLQPATSLQHDTVLDKGIVKSLRLVEWDGEADQRLVVVALCDAANLDGSDPVLWLKLACAARRLSRQTTPAGPLKFRRLERHALEEGTLAIPDHLPPNRLITRALEEVREMEFDVYPAIITRPQPPTTLVLDLPRYSWSTLARMLMRVCREGTTNPDGTPCGSPCVAVRISPMLVLPSRPLGAICEFLDSRDIWRFEATCRALSASIIAARVSLEQSKAAARSQATKVSTPDDGDAMDSEEAAASKDEASRKDAPTSSAAGLPDDQEENRSKEKRAKVESSRSSKRVRSQLITSGKRSERESKRKSVEYCLLAAVLGCTMETAGYKALAKNFDCWDIANHEETETSKDKITRRYSSLRQQQPQSTENEVRLGDSCITAFVQRWSTNSGPADILERFVGHVADNVESVFSDDSGETLVLASFILESIELLQQRSGVRNSLGNGWFGLQIVKLTHSAERAKTSFAVNLLYAELLLRRCEGQPFLADDYDDDSNVVSMLLQELMIAISELEERYESWRASQSWIAQKIRCHWLAAAYFLWRRKSTHVLHEATEAESRALEQINDLLELMGSPSSSVDSVETPHLSSPRRLESHWKSITSVGLGRFRDEIQSSAVVSSSRHKFLEAIEDLQSEHGLDKASSKMEDVRITLMERFGPESDARHEELIDDFIATVLSDFPRDLDDSRTETIPDSMAQRWGDAWQMLPLHVSAVGALANASNPSILAMLCFCIALKEEGNIDLVLVISRALLAAIKHQNALLRPTEDPKKSTSDDDSDFSYSDDDMSDDEMGSDGVREAQKGELAKILLTENVIRFLLDKLWVVIEALETEEVSRALESSEFNSMVGRVLDYVADWYTAASGPSRLAHYHASLDHSIFVRVNRIAQHLMSSSDQGSVSSLGLRFFVGLSKIVVKQRQMLPSMLLPGKLKGVGQRSQRQKQFVSRIALLATVGSLWASSLSKTPVSIRGLDVTSSPLVESLKAGPDTDRITDPRFATVLETLIWLWRKVAQAYSSLSITSLERQLAEELSAPVAAMIISLCGGTLAMITRKQQTERQLGLDEFFDSDASANEDAFDESEESDPLILELRRSLCQAVQCVSNVFEVVDNKAVMSYVANLLSAENQLVPLVSIRVLGNLSDLLLTTVREGKRSDSLWAEQYPFGVRTSGLRLDRTLHRAYKYMFGFSLSISKETSHDDSSATGTLSESPLAACQLYRCIRRTYEASRRSPPHSSLVCAISALPPAKETKRRGILKKFLFTSSKGRFSAKDVQSILLKEGQWEKAFEDLDFMLAEDESEQDDDTDDEEAQILRARKGLCKDLAAGPLPSLSSNASRSSDPKSETDERSSTRRHEKALARKFQSLFDHLCLGERYNPQGWLTAGQCLVAKADVVADRCGLSQGFVRGGFFSVPSKRIVAKNLLKLSELKEKQEMEFNRRVAGWTPYVGNDLSIFVDSTWSSLDALKLLTKEIKIDHGNAVDRQVHGEIFEMLRMDEFVTFQQAWGGIFVEALRTLAIRCFLVAQYLLQTSREKKDGHNALQSEVSEFLGLLNYSKLSGGQVYGFPMMAMTPFEKRSLAEVSCVCFQQAIEAVKSSSEKNDNNDFTWDFEFMVGKCHEKRARTLRNESFSNASNDGETAPTRAYEWHMVQALQAYSRALTIAKKEEEDAGVTGTEGGSSHGSMEVLYRLHAARLKCMLSAVQMDESVRNTTESEALRLVESCWFSRPACGEEADEEPTDVRSRVWRALADIVDAFVHCRSEHPFFHRSVYRHAQCLMWAPVFDNPTTGYAPGSLGVVPATKSVKLRGLNSSTSSANSAEVVIGALFEKKRPQLVGLWFTAQTNMPSPFEFLNESMRKYDSLRGKYLAAYIECLRICRRASQLETLHQWVIGSNRDLPSFYQASAMNNGGPPQTHHNRDSLLMKTRSLETVCFLTEIKRHINEALTYIVMKDFAAAEKKDAPEFLKRAYSYFLRTNCTLAELAKTRGWKFGRTIPAVNALCDIHSARRKDHKVAQKDVMNWSGGGDQKSDLVEAALKVCKELFPNMATTIYRVRKAAKKKKPSSATEHHQQLQQQQEAGDNDTDGNLKQFVVDVPAGLNVGDKFQTTVEVGEQTKTIRLTVPKGNPEKLKFTLTVPGSGDGGPPSKRAKIETGD